MLTSLVIDRTHPRQTCNYHPIRPWPLPVLLLNVSIEDPDRVGTRKLSGPQFKPRMLLRDEASRPTPSTSSHPKALLSRQHFALISPLAATLTKTGGRGPGYGLTRFPIRKSVPPAPGEASRRWNIPTLSEPPRNISPFRRTVAFPQHGTSCPLCGAPSPRTIELHAGSKLASRTWPPRALGH